MGMTETAKLAKIAAGKLGALSSHEKNKILGRIAASLDLSRDAVLRANSLDLQNARQSGLSNSLIDRLTLNDKRIDSMILSLRQIARQKDCVGRTISSWKAKSGLLIKEKSVPLGVVAVIFESRPNVTVEICGLCLKSSCSAILKGGKEAINTNKALVGIISSACDVANAFQLVCCSRKSVFQMLTMRGYIDAVIPRGGRGLIEFVRENSRIPVIETGSGNCHIFVDETADFRKAIRIIINAKVSRPSVCNAAEKVLIHKNIRKTFLPMLKKELEKHSVRIRGCNKTRQIIECGKAEKTDWKREYLDLIIAIKVVGGLEQAIEHINKYSTAHSEAIISKNKASISLFCEKVDSAVVYSNASTRFTDGYEFGFGAELGISTQKLHARGPMGLKALTTTKFIVKGSGQVRA